MSEPNPFDQYHPMPPEPYGLPAAEHRGAMTRPEFLGLMGGLGIGLVLGKLGLDRWASTVEQRLEATEGPSGLYVLREGNPSVSTEAIIAMPGMGEHLGLPLARLIEKECELNSASTLAYFNLGNDITLKKTIGDLKDMVHKNKIESMSLYLNSMAAVIAMAAALEVGVPLRRIFMNSSPFDIQDVGGGEMAHIIARLPNTGIEGKFIGSGFKSIRNEHAFDRKVLAKTYHDTITGSSMKMLMAELRLLDHIQLARLFRESPNAGKIITPETEVYYFRPENLSDDTVVYDNAAVHKWRDVLTARGASFADIGIASDEHADNAAAIKAMPQAIRNSRNYYSDSAFLG